MVNQNNFIDELKNYNEEALNYILDVYGNLIYKVAYNELKSVELSEECLNTVLLKVWQKASSYNEDISKFKNWLCAISKYTAIDMLRKEGRHFSTSNEEVIDKASENNLEDSVLTQRELEFIKTQIMNFNEIDRDIFIKRFFLNQSLKEIGEALNMTDKSVSLRISRARKKLIKMELEV
ncbi:MAG: sigma-70 family RNA polymerase sigma factor [Clostridium sp.]